MQTLRGDALIETARRHRDAECSVALDKLAHWIELELELELARWKPAEMTLRHFRYVLTADGPMRRQDERCVLLGIWGTTLSDLVLDIRAGRSTLGHEGPPLTGELDGLAENCAEADLVRMRLRELSELAQVDTPSPLTYPLSPPCRRSDLRSLLAASSPPAMQGRDDVAVW